MPWRKKTAVKFWAGVVVLCFLAALAVMGLSRLIQSFYSYEPSSYEPKDRARGEQVERGQK